MHDYSVSIGTKCLKYPPLLINTQHCSSRSQCGGRAGYQGCLPSCALHIHSELHWPSKSNNPSLVPRLLPRKLEREPGRFYHMSHDLVCVVLCMFWWSNYSPLSTCAKSYPFVQFKYSVYGRSYRTPTRILQCSHASVGVTQARPNYSIIWTPPFSRKND